MAMDGYFLFYKSSNMSFIGKWFGFGKDPAFDDGIRAYEKKAFAEALAKFKESVQGANDRAIKDRARSYVAGSLGKLAAESVQARDFESALNYLYEATELRPDFADLWLSLARVQFIFGDVDLAEASAKRALEINPGYSLAKFLIGLIQFKREKFTEGISELKKAVSEDRRLDSKDWQEGLEAYSAGDMALALKNFKEVRPAPTNVHDLVSAGDSAAKKGQWEMAKESYGQAAELAPNYADVSVRLGQALLELNELESALEQFHHASKVNPTYVEAIALRGVVLRRLDRDTEAVSAFKEALKLDPNHPIASQEVLYRRI